MLHSPQVLTLKISCTGTVFPGPPVLDVQGQQLHQVVGVTVATLAFDGFGQANRDGQGWAHNRNTHICPDRTWMKTDLSVYFLCCTSMKSTAEIRTAVGLLLASAACVSFCCILAALTPNTQLLTTALSIFSTRLKINKDFYWRLQQNVNQ